MPRWTPFLVTLVACGGVLPLLVFYSAPAPAVPLTLQLFACMVTVVSSSAMFAWTVQRESVRVVEAVFWLAVYVFFGIAPLSQITYNKFPPLADSTLLAKAEVVVLIGCAAFYGGAQLRGSGLVRAGEVRNAGREISVPRIFLATPLAWLASTYYISTLGGVSPFFKSRASLTDSFTAAGLNNGSLAGSAILTAIGTIPVLICFSCLLVLTVSRREFRTPGYLLILLISATFNVIVNNPISNPRYWFLAVLFCCLFSFPNLKPSLLRSSYLFGVFAAIVVFPYSDYFRYSTGSHQKQAAHGVFATLTVKDYDQLTMTANGLWWARNHGFQLGHQFLGSLLFWVPRSDYHGKAFDTGVAIGRDMGLSNVNLSSPLWIEFWVDFGVIGVIVGMAFAGWVARHLDLRYASARLRGERTVPAASVLAAVAAGYSFILLRGPLLQAMSRLSVILLFVALLSRRRTEREQARPQLPPRGNPPNLERGRAVARAGGSAVAGPVVAVIHPEV